MTKNNLNLGSTAFIALTSAYFAIALNIKFWQFACEKIDINSFSVLFFALSLPFFIYVPLFWFFSLLVVPRIGKPLIMLLMVLSAASEKVTISFKSEFSSAISVVMIFVILAG